MFNITWIDFEAYICRFKWSNREFSLIPKERRVEQCSNWLAIDAITLMWISGMPPNFLKLIEIDTRSPTDNVDGHNNKILENIWLVPWSIQRKRKQWLRILCDARMMPLYVVAVVNGDVIPNSHSYGVCWCCSRNSLYTIQIYIYSSSIVWQFRVSNWP